MDQFVKASRQKYRWDSPQGSLSVEELWDLPLQTSKANTDSLDNIAIALDTKLNETSKTSFVTNSTPGNPELRTKFEIVLHIISVRQEEAALAAVKRANAEKKQQLLALIDKKQSEQLEGKPIEELYAIVNSL